MIENDCIDSAAPTRLLYIIKHLDSSPENSKRMADVAFVEMFDIWRLLCSELIEHLVRKIPKVLSFIYKQPDKKSLFETSVSPNLIFSSTACLKRDCRRDGSLGKLDRNSFSDCSKVSI